MRASSVQRFAAAFKFLAEDKSERARKMPWWSQLGERSREERQRQARHGAGQEPGERGRARLTWFASPVCNWLFTSSIAERVGARWRLTWCSKARRR